MILCNTIRRLKANPRCYSLANENVENYRGSQRGSGVQIGSGVCVRKDRIWLDIEEICDGLMVI